MASTITRHELKQQIDRGQTFTLVEALPLHTYEQGHLPGALCLPADEVSDRAMALLPDKNAAIVVYGESPSCGFGQRAARELSALGYTNVRHYDGGKTDWVDAGNTLQAGPPERREPDAAADSARQAFQKA